MVCKKWTAVSVKLCKEYLNGAMLNINYMECLSELSYKGVTNF